MNILFYCSEYPPCKSGGIGTVTKIVAEALAKRGHNIYVVGYYPSNTTLPEYSEINGVHIYRLQCAFRRNKFLLILYFLLLGLRKNKVIEREIKYTEQKIEELINLHNIQILEFTDYYPLNAYKLSKHVFKNFNIPTVLRIHGSISFLQSYRGESNVISKINDSLHFKRCNHINAVSDFSLQYILNNFDTSHFITQKVIPNPIENNFIKTNPPSDSNIILYIGKLTKAKGCYSVLKAFNLCAEKYPQLTLHVAGYGNIEQAKSYVNPQVLDRVHFLGFCDREQIQKEIDNCAFACIPTYFENFSMVALEIMGRQRALIFTERTSGKEIINDGENGFLVNPDNIEDIAKKIELLYNNKSLRDNLAASAYHTISEHYSSTKIVTKLEQYYQSILNY